MLLKKLSVGFGAIGALLASASMASAGIVPWQTNFQPAASPVMQDIEDFHRLLVYIIVAVSLFVLGLLIWIMIRYNARRNPVPSKVAHNTLLEVAWTVIPVIILVFIAIPSFRLLYFEGDIPKADVTLKAIGNQWNWTYEYPGQGDFQILSQVLSDDKDKAQGKPRLLGVDNPIYVPVNKTVVVETTGSDVIHSWAVPAFGVKMDAIPGRINRTWFKATKEGVYYGECSELCGVHHAFMPIEVHVVSQAAYEAWLAGAKKKFATNITPDATRFASAR
ncbi:MAG TPA: cytochrome c oxidase subunit II [Rhizomicrobium sp.]|jgi:cytochrome c oxidase subunit 2|nr:cytochrome c oxidase subunit II [Rhizomicrobium sp.]